jgi:hypothetical protein
MNALQLRDRVFSHLHATVLKAAGFRKSGHWAIRQMNDLQQSFYLRASRFGRGDKAVFWIDVQVFSKPWHDLVFAPKVFTKPSESFPSIVCEELGMHCVPPIRTLEISNARDADSLDQQLVDAAANWALPLLDRCTTIDDLLHYCATLPEGDSRYLFAAGLLTLAGRRKEAEIAISRAIALAPHSKARAWAEQRAAAILTNAA